MKKILLTTALFLFGIAAFSQKEEKNGIIYIKHPYIDVVNNVMNNYMAKDNAANEKFFADTAKFWASGMDKSIPIAAATKMFDGHFDNYDDIKVTQVGYPDYLHYIDKDSKYVQSWWSWSGKSKKTGEVLKMDFVQFDQFNDAGKIVREGLYGDFSKMDKE